MFLDIPSPVIDATDIRRHSANGSYPPIVLDDGHFLISQADFDALPEYTATKPTGVYAGKCWKAQRGKDDWWIACYIEEIPPHPDGMLTPFRRALIV